MLSNYTKSLAYVLKDEGGYTNDPRDPGGPTNFGITIADYRMYINKGGTAEDVKNMTVTQAKTIYKSKYWDAMNCSDLPSGVDYTVFDYGVNSGITRSKRVYNQFKSLSDPVKIINAINDERLAFLKSLKTWPTFGKGWGPRVQRVRTNSISMATMPSTAHTATAGAVIVGGAGTMASTPHHYWPYIIAGSILALIIGLVTVNLIKGSK